jgi:hypothetical protein
MPRISPHARKRMMQRQITEADIRSALRRRYGQPRPGDNGRIVVLGYASGRRILRVVLTADSEEIVSVMWLGD